jgi:nicotinate-nucleotide pyrophosphorylase (carboxylating)
VKDLPFGPLDPALYRETVRRALAEDLGWGDITTEAVVLPEQRARGVLVAKTTCVLAGIDIALEAFRQLDPRLRMCGHREDGTACAAGEELGCIEGRAQALLTAERVALNFLQRLSGIATLTRQCVDAAQGRTRVLDTRKTTPLLRALEKYAVRAGGGTNHRLSLDDGVLIKDNHVQLAGGVAEALRRARVAQPELPVEVEVQSMAEVDEALAAGATRLLADNFPDDELREVLRRAKGHAQVEVSGRVTCERVSLIAGMAADFVSVGALTHSAPWVDISFELTPLPDGTGEVSS